MCGIAGIAAPADDPGHAGDFSPALDRMSGALVHRGPDAGGRWQGGKVLLAHRRLGVIDPGRGADQPMHSPDGRFQIVYNGEVYNFKELRSALPGHPFRTNSDTEVVLAAWADRGDRCLKQLEGMFAFAIWDVQGEELTLVRDRFGEKPVYYAQLGKRLLFASELRALLASDMVPRKLDQEALIDHMRHGAVHGPSTLVQGVRMLQPGHLLRWSASGGIRIRRWWNMAESVDPAVGDLPRAELLRQVRDRFFHAVEKRLVADVPVGAFLSGGIDSSAVVGAMAQVSATPVHTFTITFDEAEFSEARFAKIIAEKFGTKHTEIRLRPEEMLHLLPQALAGMDHPSADGPNTWVVSKMTKEAGITVALSGLGGDELFAGYEVFKRSLALLRNRHITAFPRPLRNLAAYLMQKARPGAAGWKAAELLKLSAWRVADTYPLARLSLGDGELRKLLTGPLGPDAVAADVRHELEEVHASRLQPLAQVSLAELGSYLVDTLLRDTDQMAMAHALEVRAPFLDHTLASLVLGVPDRAKFPHTPKKLLTDALGDLLPKEVVHRPKMGFTLPWDQWMREPLRHFCAVRMESLGRRAQFDASGVQHLWERFLSRDPAITWTRVWMLVVLEEWMQANRVE